VTEADYLGWDFTDPTAIGGGQIPSAPWIHNRFAPKIDLAKLLGMAEQELEVLRQELFNWILQEIVLIWKSFFAIGQSAVQQFENAVHNIPHTDVTSIFSGLAVEANTLGADIQGTIDGIVNGLNGAAVTFNNEVASVESQVGGFVTGLFNGWTGSAVAAASSADLSTAAAAAATQAAAQAQQTAAIQSELPHFYGAKGANGVNVNETFTGSLPGDFTAQTSIASHSALYNGTSDTDQQTVSGVWNATLLAAGPRYFILRSDSTMTNYVYAKLWETYAVGVFTIHYEMGCVVSGVKTVIDSYSQNDYYQGANLMSSNASISFEATSNTFTLTWPGCPNAALRSRVSTDAGNVSQIGSSYRYAGIANDETSLPGALVSWNFYDSGPISGPASAYVSTSENTGSTTYTDLATTTDQITINIGASGLAIVSVYAHLAYFSSNTISYVGFALSGANSASAADNQAVWGNFVNVTDYAHGATFLLTGLAAGATTFKMKYRVSGGTGTFSNRRIAVIPL
jgi:hypothetical protein